MLDRGFFVFLIYDEEWFYNKLKLFEVNKLFLVVKIIVVGKGFYFKFGESEKVGGFFNIFYISKGLKVMFLVNFCVWYGFFNGVIGIIEDILYFSERRLFVFFDVVMVYIFSYSGFFFLLFDLKFVFIVLVERKIDCRCYYCKCKFYYD